MAEKRRSKRHPKRLKVLFGDKSTNGFPLSGLTNDVSSTGLFVVSSHNPKPGTRLHLQVILQGESPLFMEGIVTRQVHVPPELRQVVRSGFGVRFLQGAELVAELAPTIASTKKTDPFWLEFNEPEAWRQAAEKEYKRGGVFVWSPEAAPQNAIITVTFDLRFQGRQLAFQARVVHVMPGPDGRFGVALMFLDPVAAAAALSGTLKG